MTKRVISALVALPLLFLAVLINKDIFFVSLVFLTLVGLHEYFAAVDNSGYKTIKVLGFSFGLALLLLVFLNGNLNFFALFITIALISLYITMVFNKKYNLFGVAATIVGIIYIPLFFSYLYLIRAIPDKGVYLIWFVFILAFFTDTFAYFTGIAFGKTKLCPTVSPKKTVEGSIGGIIGATVGTIVYGLILNKIGIIDISLIRLLLLGIIGSVISQFGDLSASSIKRFVNIKDYGKIMPGHGGVLDRFDSIIFVAPLIYYYILYILL
jgi:phosphatidate cytidylyltransferase